MNRITEGGKCVAVLFDKACEEVSWRNYEGLVAVCVEKLTFHLEKGWEKLELVILGGDGIRELLAVVEGLQKGLEAVVYQRHDVNVTAQKAWVEK
jgi:hypothetical protein